MNYSSLAIGRKGAYHPDPALSLCRIAQQAIFQYTGCAGGEGVNAARRTPRWNMRQKHRATPGLFAHLTREEGNRSPPRRLNYFKSIGTQS